MNRNKDLPESLEKIESNTMLSTFAFSGLIFAFSCVLPSVAGTLLLTKSSNPRRLPSATLEGHVSLVDWPVVFATKLLAFNWFITSSSISLFEVGSGFVTGSGASSAFNSFSLLGDFSFGAQTDVLYKKKVGYFQVYFVK